MLQRSIRRPKLIGIDAVNHCNFINHRLPLPISYKFKNFLSNGFFLILLIQRKILLKNW